MITYQLTTYRLRTEWCRYLVQKYHQNQNYVPKHFCNLIPLENKIVESYTILSHLTTILCKLPTAPIMDKRSEDYMFTTILKQEKNILKQMGLKHFQKNQPTAGSIQWCI